MSTPTPADLPVDRWSRVIVPTAKGFERFFWNLAWFVTVLAVVFGNRWLPSRSPTLTPREQIGPIMTRDAAGLLSPTQASAHRQ